MILAATYENGQVFQHFGHTPAFKLFTIENGAVTASEVVPTNGSGHGALAGFLSARGVNALICGGIGGGARTALASANIEVYGGVQGNADDAAAAFAAGQLRFDPDAACSHHEHAEGHTCGEHGCGEHDCGDHAHGQDCHCGH